MLNSTIRSSRSGMRSIAPRPIAPPQSWATSVTSSQIEPLDERRQIVDVVDRAAASRGGLSLSPQPRWSGATQR